MRIYLAGGQASWRSELEGRNLLVSFAEPKQLKLLSVDWYIPSLYLDSGAFTAWTRGKQINLSEYCEYILTKIDRIERYFALDVIPGVPGMQPTQAEIIAAAEQSIMNFICMRNQGLRPIPVYHQGEPLEVLDEYVGMGCDLIGLGGTYSRGRPSLVEWLKPIFARHPNQNFHGLAMTQARIIGSFPFFSVDSTSWLNFARFGVEANKYLLKDRSASCLRKIGIAAIEDIRRYSIQDTMQTK